MPLIDISCPICGKIFQRKESWVKRKPERIITCSYACSHKAVRRQRRPPIFLTGLCKTCGKTFTRKRDWKGTTVEFCCRRCQALGNLKKRWEGHTPTEKRPWAVIKAMKEKVKLIGKCEKCGSTENLHAHHKIQFNERPDLGADFDNIEVLCRPCHGKAHNNHLTAFITYPVKHTGRVAKCAICTNLLYKKPYEIKKGTIRYCSNKCRMIGLNSKKKSFICQEYD